jgi:hypothetical protein
MICGITESDIEKVYEMLRHLKFMLVFEYPELAKTFIDHLKFLVLSFENDPITSEIKELTDGLYKCLFICKGGGNVTLKSGLLADLRNAFLPIVLKTLKYIPLPRIDICDKEYDFSLNNIVIRTEHLIPSLVDFVVTNECQILFRKDLPSEYFINVVDL